MSVINTNVKALAAAASANSVEKTTATAMERLSTGLRINSAKDDAAGLAITNRMTTQIRGYAVAIRNANDGISMAQTAEGALGQISSVLQRMRELAVQATNGTLSASDRGNLNLEISQLKKEIDTIASTTNHNNIKLLDGSAGKINLQTGVNAGELVTIGFNSAKTKDIGQGTVPALSSNAVSTSALTAGDLLINGVSVGASVAADDTLSTASQDGSAISKAAAINRVSAQSGVTATVGKTTSYGASMTAAAKSGTITINGVATDTIYTTTDAEASRIVVAAAINNISSRTGVRAINTGDDKQGVILIADDGRNIDVAAVGAGGTDLTEASTGVKHNTTVVGNFTLTSADSSPISISTKVGGDLGLAGLSEGTYSSNISQTVTYKRTQTAAGVAPSDTTTGVLNGNTLVINDVSIAGATAGDDAASFVSTTSTKAASAIAIAAAINKSTATTGVTAKAEANILYGTGFSAGAVDNFAINGVTLIGATSTQTTSRDQVITLINSKSGQTGVTAVQNGAGIKLVAADGRNIVIGLKTGSVNSLGLTGVTVGTDITAGALVTHYSKVSLSSDKEFTVRSGSESNANFALLGFRNGTFGGSGDGQKIAAIDISTAAGATKAISAVDAALEKISSQQAMTGSYLNRLDASVSNLTEANQNMSAARSRILDADYATETTSLARSQIIQQAATAMLAQANQSAQTVLALLK